MWAVAVVVVQTESWDQARSVVSGRLINGYSGNDLVLALLYRYGKTIDSHYHARYVRMYGFVMSTFVCV